MRLMLMPEGKSKSEVSRLRSDADFKLRIEIRDSALVQTIPLAWSPLMQNPAGIANLDVQSRNHAICLLSVVLTVNVGPRMRCAGMAEPFLSMANHHQKFPEKKCFIGNIKNARIRCVLLGFGAGRSPRRFA